MMLMFAVLALMVCNIVRFLKCCVGQYYRNRNLVASVTKIWLQKLKCNFLKHFVVAPLKNIFYGCMFLKFFLWLQLFKKNWLHWKKILRLHKKKFFGCMFCKFLFVAFLRKMFWFKKNGLQLGKKNFLWLHLKKLFLVAFENFFWLHLKFFFWLQMF